MCSMVIPLIRMNNFRPDDPTSLNWITRAYHSTKEQATTRTIVCQRYVKDDLSSEEIIRFTTSKRISDGLICASSVVSWSASYPFSTSRPDRYLWMTLDKSV